MTAQFLSFRCKGEWTRNIWHVTEFFSLHFSYLLRRHFSATLTWYGPSRPMIWWMHITYIHTYFIYVCIYVKWQQITPQFREMLKKLSGTADIIMAKLDKCLLEKIHLFDIPSKEGIRTSNTFGMKQLIQSDTSSYLSPYPYLSSCPHLSPCWYLSPFA